MFYSNQNTSIGETHLDSGAAKKKFKLKGVRRLLKFNNGCTNLQIACNEIRRNTPASLAILSELGNFEYYIT